MDIINRGTIATTPGDLPDYSAPRPLGQVPVGPVYTSTDIAELAARLGSPDTFDRRGNVIWFDDFESGINKWMPDGTGVNWTVTWDSTRARNGDFSVKLATATEEDKRVGIIHYFPFPVLSGMGFEFSWTRAQNLREIQIVVFLRTGTVYHNVGIKWLAADNFFYYYNNIGGFTITPYRMAFLEMDDYVFNTIKLVVDYTKGKYVRLIANNFEFDLSNLEYETLEIESIPQAYVDIWIRTDDNLSAIAYIDDVIITQNEPPND